MSSSNMVAVLWGSDLGKGIIDGAAVPCCSWCFEGILKPFHHDFRSRLLGGETAEWIGAATGVLGVFGTFARCCCCCCDAGWDGGVGAADVMVATARRWAAERAPRVAVCCVSASPGSRVQDRIGSCMDGCESEMERQQGRGTWGSPERYARGCAGCRWWWWEGIVVLRRDAVYQAGARFSATGAGSGRSRSGVLKADAWDVCGQRLKNSRAHSAESMGVVGAGPAEFRRLFSDETTTCLAVAGWLSQVK